MFSVEDLKKRKTAIETILTSEEAKLAVKDLDRATKKEDEAYKRFLSWVKGLSDDDFCEAHHTLTFTYRASNELQRKFNSPRFALAVCLFIHPSKPALEEVFNRSRKKVLDRFKSKHVLAINVRSAVADYLKDINRKHIISLRSNASYLQLLYSCFCERQQVLRAKEIKKQEKALRQSDVVLECE